MEIAADQLDFLLANGNELKTGDTVGKAQITILPGAGGFKAGKERKRRQEHGRLQGDDRCHGR